MTALPAANPMLFDRNNHVDIVLDSSDFVLRSVSPDSLSAGSNRAVVGAEIIQFASARHLGGAAWRLEGLVRGRGGTESVSVAGLQAGLPFILLDDALMRIDPNLVGAATRLAAVGLADDAAVEAAILERGRSLKPLMPVHPAFENKANGILSLSWVRRARGAWTWPEEVELALVEEREQYDLGVGPVDTPIAQFTASTTRLSLSTTVMGELRQSHMGAPVWVRQIGQFAKSDALFLTTIEEKPS